MNKRTINYIFVHCTATHPTTTIETIQQGWRNIGWKNPGYHYVVKADGTFVKLQSEERTANGVRGRNANAIHVAYVGGLRVIDGAKVYADTRTEYQRTILRLLLREIHARYPKAVIMGHRSIWGEETPWRWEKVCPCFNAINEYADI